MVEESGGSGLPNNTPPPLPSTYHNIQPLPIYSILLLYMVTYVNNKDKWIRPYVKGGGVEGVEGIFLIRYRKKLILKIHFL